MRSAVLPTRNIATILSENNNMPSNDENTSDVSDCDGRSSRRGSDTTKKAFDLEAFHQLRQERLENKRRAAQLRKLREDKRSRLLLNSTVSSPSLTITSSIEKVKRKSCLESSSSSETDSFHKLSARQELLRLGKRYASISSSVEQRRLPSSQKKLTMGDLTSPKALFSSPTNGRNCPSEHGGSSEAHESGITNDSPQYINMRSHSVPMETMSHNDNEISVVTPDQRVSSEDYAGIHGIHYLLLARTNSSPIRSNKDSSADAAVIDADDGSSSASYNTPTPHLQAASACDSHGENDDVCEDHHHCRQQDVERETDHFSAFFTAQVFISEIEDNPSRQLDAGSDNLVQTHKARTWKITYYVARFTLVIVVGATMYYFWRYIASWYRLTYPGMSPAILFSALHSWLDSIPAHSLSLESMWNALHSKMTDGVEQTMLLHSHYTSHLIMWSKVVWSAPVSLYENWTKDVDVLCSIIESIYRIEKLYYDTSQLFTGTVLDIQESSAVARNVTLSVAISCWQQLGSVQLSHLFSKSTDPIVIKRATLTDPIVFYSNNECPSRLLENETALFDNGDDVKTIIESSSPPFWRKPVRGTPFVRHQLPSIRQDFHRYIHSIPSLGIQPEGSDSSRLIAFINPTFDGLQQRPNERSKDLYPVIGLGRSRLSLHGLRLDSIGTSSDMRKNIAAALIMQQSRPPHRSGRNIPQAPQSQVMISKKRNYYSSNPTQEQPHEKDIFEDVDVMDMAREFVAQLLKRGKSSKIMRRKKKGSHEENSS